VKIRYLKISVRLVRIQFTGISVIRTFLLIYRSGPPPSGTAELGHC
jgi:hypothetical protein